MPLFLRSLAASGKQTLAFIDTAASQILRTLCTSTHTLEDVSSFSPENATSASTSNFVFSAPESESEFEDLSVSSDPDTDTGNESSQRIENPSFQDDSEMAETCDQAADSIPLELDAEAPATFSISPQNRPAYPGPSRRVPYHPYMYSTGIFSPGSANRREHLASSPFRRHRSFVRSCSLPPPSAMEPVRAPPSKRSLSVGPSSPSTKRPRDPDSGSDDLGEDSERPRTRRRFSVPQPICTRAACHHRARSHPEEDHEASLSDNEDAWSTAAQPSDTEPDPNDAIFRVRTGRSVRKRLREERDDSDAKEHSPKRFSRTREGH
ncbi:hypothetical protein BC628DRAFT_1393329 [Trametes gibbosa]|nr:hypothetical protein BC628DRAFT_1393329 [Trametes gibbosa]